jgi:hypothetical protein
VFQVFWCELAKSGAVLPAYRLGLDVVNCEGVSNMPMLASVLHGAGKTVVAWADQDTPDATREVARLKAEKHCAALVLHDPTPGRQNLEQALAWGCSLAALAEAMQAIATDRGYSWEDQRSDLLSRCEGVPPEVREHAKVSESVATFFSALEEGQARHLAAVALGAKRVAPFEMKGARQARLMAETIIRKEGVPANFARAFRQLDKWIREGCASGVEIQMKCDA